MTKLLLDTTFLVSAERGGRDLDEVVRDEDDVAMAAITVAELLVGVLLADSGRRAARASYVEDLVAAIPVVDYDIAVAEAHAALLAQVRAQGTPRGAHDLVIAASARATDRVIVSADRRAFSELDGIEVRSHP